MRLVVLCDSTRFTGGAEMMALLTARLVAERGIPVDFIVGDDSAGDGSAPGVRFHSIGATRINPLSDLGPLTAALYNRKVRDFVARFVAENDSPEVVYHVHAWSNTLSPAVFDALTPVAERVFLHAHDFFLSCPNANFFNFQTQTSCGRKPLSLGCVATPCSKRSGLDKLWRTTRGVALKRIIRRDRAWRVLMIHEGMRARFEADGFAPDKLTTVLNPSVPLSATPAMVAANRSFLFVGRLSREKGADLACAAAQAAGVDLVVVGDGEMRADLEAAYPNVRFTGWLERAEIAPLAQRSRALLMSSRSPEPFGLAITEALGAGLPVIVADTAFLAPDLARHGCGRVVNVLDRQAFAAAIRELDRDDALAARMSRNALATFRDISPAPDAWADQIIAQYGSALSADEALRLP